MITRSWLFWCSPKWLRAIWDFDKEVAKAAAVFGDVKAKSMTEEAVALSTTTAMTPHEAWDYLERQRNADLKNV